MSPVRVQSMTKTDTRNIHATNEQINELTDCGCEVVRIAVPDNEAAQALTSIKHSSKIPIIADIHFDYRLALSAIKAGVDGLRINPGNIHEPDHIKKIVSASRERSIPIRIGVNAGSLPADKLGLDSISQRMVNAALEQVKLLEDLNYDLIKISLKAFDVPTTIESYRLIASQVPYPLHIGITEAGLPRTGVIRSAIGIGILLNEGIGDTIRVSLSSNPCDEVFTAYEILKSLDLRDHGPTLISCPSCGRTEVDIVGLANAVDRQIRNIKVPMKIAVMGCVVNGPGEAKDADIGIACGKGKGVIFKKGNVVHSVEECDFLTTIMKEIKDYIILD